MIIRREEIVAAIQARMEAIQVGGSVAVGGEVYEFQSDVGCRVYRWRGVAIPENLSPALVIRDTASPVDEDGAAIGYWNHELTVHIGLVTHGQVPDTEVRQMVFDVLQAIGSDGTFGGLADGTALVRVGLEAEQGARYLMGALVEIEVRYSTPRWQI